MSVSTVAVGKSASTNVVFGFTYRFFSATAVTPVPFANSTLILSSGSLPGSAGSTTLSSLTINICFATSNVEVSLNVTSSVPSFSPATADVLSGCVLSVTVASFSRAATLSLFSSFVAFTPFDQVISSFTHTFIVSGLSPPNSSTCSAIFFVYTAL